MNIVSWNVNGLRSILKKKYLYDLINNEKPDILCLSETKITDIDIKILDVNNKINYKFHYYNNSSERKGYSGTYIFSNIEPINILYGILINNIQYDTEGRVLTLELEKYYLINVYTPNSGENLKRLDWRIDIWDNKFKEFILLLKKHKPVIICGDLNVAHKEIDIKNPDINIRNAGFTIEERYSFTKLLKECDLIDVYRKKYPKKIEYTYWSYRSRSRLKNIGWRLDYFLISKEINKNILNCIILNDMLGSDHAPIKLILK